MLTASLQSTWESQKSKQNNSKSNNRYNGTYGYNLIHEEPEPAAYNNNDSRPMAKSLFATQPYGNPNNLRMQNENGNYPELPNLKIPQISAGRLNLSANVNGSTSTAINNLNGTINTNSVTSASPRGNSTGPAREILNVGRKYHRGSSRQQSSQNAYRGNRRQKYGEGTMNGETGQSQLQQQTNGNSNISNIIQASKNSMQMNSPSDNTQLLPQISGANNGNPQAILPSANGARWQTQQQNSQNKDFGYNSISTSNNLPGTTTEEHNHSAIMSIKGLKPGNPNWTNQDNFFAIESFDGKDIRIYCVLDGHGENGHHVSKRCREYFPQYIKATSMEMTTAFNMMQNDLNNLDIDVKCSGATCVMATFVGNKLSVYNCGDSRAVLGRRNPNGSISAHALSNDHKPDKPEERKRILNCGGHLGCRQVLVNQGGRGPVSMPVGPCRVWYQHRGETLGLAMSRSLGDVIVHKCGVSAEPEQMDHVVDDYDEFCILATDGVWDVVDNQHAVQMVHNFAVRTPNWSPLEAASTVCKFARSRWEKLSPMVDDITCIIVKIHR